MILLLLTGLGAAGVKAQVRIGGNTPPNPAAALDLNAAEGTTTGTKGLALPRVTLGSSTATLDGTTANINGMLVFNTGGSLRVGIYYWNGSNWVPISENGAVGNAVVGATPGGGLVLSGTGTSSDPLTLGISPGGVTASMLSVGLGSAGFVDSITLTLPKGVNVARTAPGNCSPSTCWFTTSAETAMQEAHWATNGQIFGYQNGYTGNTIMKVYFFRVY